MYLALGENYVYLMSDVFFINHTT